MRRGGPQRRVGTVGGLGLGSRLRGAAVRWASGLITALLLAVIHQLWRAETPLRQRPASGVAETLQGLARPVDGDTLVLDGVRIRLVGLDAPELAQSCGRDRETWPCGRASLDALVRLVEDPVTCRGERRDRYGRLLATCLADGQDIGAILVRTGQAVAFGGYPDEEAEARRAGRGVWAGHFERPADWRRDRRQEEER